MREPLPRVSYLLSYPAASFDVYLNRWLKYEETVEVGDRWSKPHVATTSMHSLIELRRALMDGRCIIGLDLKSSKKHDTIAGKFCMLLSRSLKEDLTN